MAKILKFQKTIVVSAVNLKVGGTLTILRDCLQYLSQLAGEGEYRVVALVYQQALVDYPNIEYIEDQWPKQRWVNRLWFEYVSMSKISKTIGPVYLWLSLHDTTPNVVAERRAVYCHNPFPFYRWTWKECVFSPQIVLLALFSKYIYQTNIHQNDLVIVQQQWIKDAFKRMFNLSDDKIIVAVPDSPKGSVPSEKNTKTHQDEYTFMYAASSISHKNFECLCKATAILEQEGLIDFKVYITIDGHENGYSKWLMKNWGYLSAITFMGFVDRATLFDYYATCNCLIFPSKVETWGLPISEFSAFHKPMLLADLPYAHETAAGCKQVAFFDPDRPDILAGQMKSLIQGDASFLSPVPEQPRPSPVAHSWEELFHRLLQSSLNHGDQEI